METYVLVHPQYPNKVTVTNLQKGEVKGWNGDRYVSRGPSTVIVSESNAEWSWVEYDLDAPKALDRITSLHNVGYDIEE